MSSTLQSLIQTFAGKGTPFTGSLIFPIVVTIAGFTLQVVQTYFPKPTANVKLVPFLPPAPSTPSFTPTSTPTLPLTPTRTTDFIDSRSAGTSYIWSVLVLVLIGILVGTGSMYIRTKSGTIFTPRDSSSQKEEREEEDPPREPPDGTPPNNSPPEEIQPSDDDDDDDYDDKDRYSDSDDNAEDQDSSGDENEDDAEDSQDEEEDAESSEEESEDDSASMDEGSPGGDPDDPSDSDSSNDEDIPPARFEPDLWDVFMLTLIYIFAITSIIRHALRKRSVLNALEKRLGTSAVSIKTKASSFFERAFQWGDVNFHWTDALQISFAMNDADVDFGNRIQAEFGNTTTSAITLNLDGVDVVDEVKPTLIEGLLSPISPRLSKVSSPIQLPELPEVVIEALPLPVPETSITPEPESFVVRPDPSTTEAEPGPFVVQPDSSTTQPDPSITKAGPEPFVIQPDPSTTETEPEPFVVQPDPSTTETEPEPFVVQPDPSTIETELEPFVVQPDSSTTEAEPESFVVQPDSSTTQAENDSLRLLRAWSGWGTVVLLIRKVVIARRQRRAGTTQHQPNAEIKVDALGEDEGEDEGSTAVENLGGSMTSNILVTSRDKTDDGEDEETDTHQPSDLLGDSFVTAEEPSINSEEPDVEPEEPNESQHEDPVIPTIKILTSTPNTPESTTCPNICTPSFAGVFTSSTLHPNHAGETEWTPGPSFIQSPDQSFTEATTPFTFTFSTPPRRTNTKTNTNTDADNDFMFTSFPPGRTPQFLPSNEIKAYLSSPAMRRKRRRLDESGAIGMVFPIGIGTPSFNGVFSSSPANDRPAEEVGSPTTPNTFLSGSMTSLSEDCRLLIHTSPNPSTPNKTKTYTDTDTDAVFGTTVTSPSFDGVFCSPAVQRNRRWHVEETKETPAESVDDDEKVDKAEEEELEVEEPVEQVYEEEEDLGEKDMDIEDQDHSVIYDLETLRALEQEPELTAPSLTPQPSLASTDSEDNQTILDPEIIARGAAEMMRQLQEDMEREKAAKERRAEKAKQREPPKDGERRKYVGPLEALKRKELEHKRLSSTGGFLEVEQAESSSQATWQSPRSRTVQDVVRMRALVAKAYAAQCYNDEQIDELTWWHLGYGNVAGHHR